MLENTTREKTFGTERELMNEYFRKKTRAREKFLHESVSRRTKSGKHENVRTKWSC